MQNTIQADVVVPQNNSRLGQTASDFFFFSRIVATINMLIILPLLEEICRHQKEEKEEKRSIVLLRPRNPAHKGVKSAGIPGLFQDIAGI